MELFLEAYKKLMPQCQINLQVNCLRTVGANALPEKFIHNTIGQTVPFFFFFFFTFCKVLLT